MLTKWHAKKGDLKQRQQWTEIRITEDTQQTHNQSTIDKHTHTAYYDTHNQQMTHRNTRNPATRINTNRSELDPNNGKQQFEDDSLSIEEVTSSS